MIDEQMTEDIIEVPYGDLYLKFPDEATASQVLENYEGSVDIIGKLFDIDNTDPENPVVTALEGWHVNTRGLVTLELQAFSVIPTVPRRVWA